METQPTTLNQLESHLWESANILRGPVDAADFKTYVVGRLQHDAIIEPSWMNDLKISFRFADA